MPYWMNCIRCNSDGSYANVDRACGKCSGLGQDWRDDDEYEWASKFAESNGLELHYEKDFPKFNQSGDRVYATLEEYKAENEPAQPASQVQPDTDDDVATGDSVERFVSIYLQLRNQNSEIYRFNAPGEGLLTGAFDLFQLDTHFPFMNQDYLAEAESDLASLESSLNDRTDIFRPLEDSELTDYLRANPEVLGLLRAQELIAHENFHVLQACSLRAVFSLAQAYRTIDRWRNYFGVMTLNSGATFKEGECIFDALRNIPDYERLLSSTLHDLSKKAKQALAAAATHAGGLSLMHLIEGSAFVAQKVSARTSAVQTFTIDDRPLYAGAWQTYQAKGGKDELVFLLVCLAAMRFGDIKRGFAHPVDIFLALAQEAPTFEAEGMTDMSNPGLGKRFGFGDARDAASDERYFWHLDVADERQKEALAHYRHEASAEINRAVDLSLNMSRRIARYVKSHFDAVGSRVDEAQMGANYIDDFLRTFGMEIYEHFPAVNTEEFCLRLLFDGNVQKPFGHCVIDAAGETAVQDIGGNVLTGNQARALSDILQRFETLTTYDALGQSHLPFCCPLHPKPGDLVDVMDCRHEESLNALMRQVCGRDLRELIT